MHAPSFGQALHKRQRTTKWTSQPATASCAVAVGRCCQDPLAQNVPVQPCLTKTAKPQPRQAAGELPKRPGWSTVDADLTLRAQTALSDTNGQQTLMTFFLFKNYTTCMTNLAMVGFSKHVEFTMGPLSDSVCKTRYDR